MLFIVAGFVLVIDQVLKAYIRYMLPVGESVPLVPGILYLTHVRNSGAAFGIFPNQRIVFFIVSIAVIFLILYYSKCIGKADRLTTISLGLVLGGAIGNLIDRAISGRVTDFIDFRFWPVFNVADSVIVIGVILLSLNLINSIRRERTEIK
ncbi:MAG: signal peptidase II [Actinobacteria bacterium]|nr:signal peptidase II [Actinomycetota bacterium]